MGTQEHQDSLETVAIWVWLDPLAHQDQQYQVRDQILSQVSNCHLICSIFVPFSPPIVLEPKQASFKMKAWKMQTLCSPSNKVSITERLLPGLGHQLSLCAPLDLR